MGVAFAEIFGLKTTREGGGGGGDVRGPSLPSLLPSSTPAASQVLGVSEPSSTSTTCGDRYASYSYFGNTATIRGRRRRKRRRRRRRSTPGCFPYRRGPGPSTTATTTATTTTTSS